ncbi:MAG: 50S ribosomal protein L10, partial [Ardenticatenales bacterium]|nr:50S ribosomal protein L10 [Ardenticatenales bacterium]
MNSLAITKEKKKELVAQYVEAATASRGMIITEFRGLSTPELGRLRAAVRGASGSYSVVKVTLFKIALERAGIPVPEDMLIGPV